VDDGALSGKVGLLYAERIYILPNVVVLVEPGNTKGGSITVPLTSCLTGLESAV